MNRYWIITRQNTMTNNTFLGAGLLPLGANCKRGAPFAACGQRCGAAWSGNDRCACKSATLGRDGTALSQHAAQLADK